MDPGITRSQGGYAGPNRTPPQRAIAAYGAWWAGRLGPARIPEVRGPSAGGARVRRTH